jgi:aminoglycoside phosphotransferase (APT) family kinase protein
MTVIDSAVRAFLVRSGLAQPNDALISTPLTGGVSSEIWRIETPQRTLCVKRALPQLKVVAHWDVPVSRNAFEWAWMQFAARELPANVPQPLAHDAEAGLFAMHFLDPSTHPVWKQQLLAGIVEPATALAVGQVLGYLHNTSAGRSDLARQFDTLDIFRALRLEPYLLTTAQRHPDIAEQLVALAERTAVVRIALVHGDVSPKNILVGPQGPVLLDAEGAWYGDPAFDLAFCLNHLLLKGLVLPAQRDALTASAAALVSAYFTQAKWEPRAKLEARAASLLPALLLARVDGKSPVEYLQTDAQRAIVRRVARPLIAAIPTTLEQVMASWQAALSAL